MKSAKFFIGLILALGFVISCDHDRIRASNEITSLEYSIPDYSGLKISNAFNAYVTFSDTEESIRIEANENVQDRIVVKRDGNSLVIKLKKFTQIRGNATLNAYITTKDISHFEIGGASTLTLNTEWNTQEANIDLSGASDFTGRVITDRLNIDMNGASNLDTFGNVGQMYAELSGSSEIRDYDLTVDQLNIELSGASQAFLSVNESISIEASGASVLNYKGDATITHQELSGASEIKNRN